MLVNNFILEVKYFQLEIGLKSFLTFKLFIVLCFLFNLIRNLVLANFE